jgi:hypothetical protein
MPARFTDSVVAAVRRRYEDTDQLVISIAAEFGVGERTINRWIAAHGWRKRSLRTRGLPVALQLMEEAKELSARSRESGNPGATGKEELDPRFRGDDRREGGDDKGAQERDKLTPADRLEALVVQQIEAEEAAHALRRGKHSIAKASERSARTLATLTQTLHALHRMRAGLPPEHESNSDDLARHDTPRDDPPRDIDEFRRELARRINAFVDSRTDGNNAGGDAAPRVVDGAG